MVAKIAATSGAFNRERVREYLLTGSESTYQRVREYLAAGLGVPI